MAPLGTAAIERWPEWSPLVDAAIERWIQDRHSIEYL